MTDSDLFSFFEIFDTLARVFTLRGDHDELRQVGGAYFNAFRRFTLEQVRAGADRWTTSGKRFPKPIEWIDSMPRLRAGPKLEQAPKEVIRDYYSASDDNFERPPCSCQACVDAGISHRPIRFVPEIGQHRADRHRLHDAETEREGKMLDGDKEFYPGHWAHGDELARWYAAKDAFWNRMAEYFGANSPAQKSRVRLTFEQRMKEIYDESGKIKPRPQPQD